MGPPSSEITQPRFILTCVHEDPSKVYILYFVHHADLFNTLLDFSTWITYKHLKLTCPKENSWFSLSKRVFPIL